MFKYEYNLEFTMVNKMNNKGQSALEYMMTYGWAILIIVIVAVILYSMGIFSPRSSVTATSSGFAPFVPSGAICGATLTVAFTTGGLPGGASSATIIAAFFNSATGMSLSHDSVNATGTAITPSTVSPGTPFTVTFKSVNCSSGVPFTAHGIIEYQYSNAAGTATVNATGTIAGTGS